LSDAGESPDPAGERAAQPPHSDRGEPDSGPAIHDPIPGFAPENDLERAVTENERLREGLAWGKPRSGHPEGTIGAHVADLLNRLDAAGVTGPRRAELRFITLVHDSFKGEVSDWRPKTGENHHAMRARRFAERYTDDERLLATIQHHDQPYATWRKMQRKGRLDEKRFAKLVECIPDMPLFLSFVELDGATEGKRPEPVHWFRGELERRGILPHAVAANPAGAARPDEISA
jgi:hypothetical protein